MNEGGDLTIHKRPPIKIDSTKCTGCRICELRCSVRFERAFSPARAAIQVRRLVGHATEYGVALTDRCDNCGICVRFCAYGCLTQDREEEVA